MNRRFWAIIIGAAVLIASFGATALAAPNGNGNDEDFIPPGLAKKVFIHYDRGNAPEGVPGGPNSFDVSPVCSDPTTDGNATCDSFSHSGIHWPDSSLAVDFSLNPNNYPGDSSGVEAAAIAASATWEADSGSYMDFSYVGQTGRKPSSLRNKRDGNNDLGWGKLNKYPNAIAVTIAWYYTSTKEIVEVDMIMSEDLPWSTTGAAGTYDVRTILLHEFGHWLLLNDLYDTSDSGQVMYGYGALGATDHDLGTGDELGIRAIYPGATIPSGGGSGDPPIAGDWGVAAVDWSERHRGPRGRFMDVIQTITAEDGNGVAAAGVTVNVRLDLLDSNSAWTGSATTNSSGQVSFQLSRASEGDYQVSITGGSEHDATLDTENQSCYDTVGNTEFSCP